MADRTHYRFFDNDPKISKEHLKSNSPEMITRVAHFWRSEWQIKPVHNLKLQTGNDMNNLVYSLLPLVDKQEQIF